MADPITIALASDHAGVALKAALVLWLRTQGYDCLDLGTHTGDSVDYPDYGNTVAHALLDGKASFGIALCGSGIGIAMAANRHRGIRAALCYNADMAKLARAHNHANVLALGARFINEEEAKACVHAFLTTPFEGGRHQQRIEKLG